MRGLFNLISELGIVIAGVNAGSNFDDNGQLVYISDHLNVHLIASANAISRHLGRSGSFFFSSANDIVKSSMGLSVHSREEAYFDLSQYNAAVKDEEAVHKLRQNYLRKVKAAEASINLGNQRPQNDIESIHNAIKTIKTWELSGRQYMVLFTDPISPFVDECDAALDTNFTGCSFEKKSDDKDDDDDDYNATLCTPIEKQCFNTFFPALDAAKEALNLDAAQNSLTWFEAIAKTMPEDPTREDILAPHRSILDSELQSAGLRLVIASALETNLCRYVTSCFVVPPEEIQITLQELSQSAAFEDESLAEDERANRNTVAVEPTAPRVTVGDALLQPPTTGSPLQQLKLTAEEQTPPALVTKQVTLIDTFWSVSSSLATWPTRAVSTLQPTAEFPSTAVTARSSWETTATPSINSAPSSQNLPTATQTLDLPTQASPQQTTFEPTTTKPGKNNSWLIPSGVATAGAPLVLALGLTGGLVYKRRREECIRSDDEYDGDFPDDLSGFSSI